MSSNIEGLLLINLKHPRDFGELILYICLKANIFIVYTDNNDTEILQLLCKIYIQFYPDIVQFKQNINQAMVFLY